MIKLSNICMFLLVVASSCLAAEGLHKGDFVEKIVDVDADVEVVVRNHRGTITVMAEPGTELSLTGYIDEEAKSFNFKHEPDEVKIEVKTPKRLGSGAGSNLNLIVPIGARLTLEGIQSEFVVNGVHGEIQCKTVSGSVLIQKSRDTVKIFSVDGDVQIADHSGQLEIETISGNIKAALNSREVELKSISGNFELISQTFDKLDLSSISGNVTLFGNFGQNAEAALKTVSGDVKLSLTGPLSAELEVVSHAKSNILIDLEKSGVGVSRFKGKRLEQTLGKGEAQIEIATVSGDVSLTQE